MLPKRSLASFTLVEMLTVIAVIAILAELTISAGSGMMTRAERSRALSEIQAMAGAIESYKSDNGVYPVCTTMMPAAYTASDGSGATYQGSSHMLYTNLTGKASFNTTPVAGAKSYITFLPNQIGLPGGNSYIKDPWGYSYGYSTALPIAGTGFYDIWSTAGWLKTAPGSFTTNTWIGNCDLNL